MMTTIGKTTKTLLVAITLCVIAITAASGNVTDERTYFEEDTSIPFETWLVLMGAGLLFLVLALLSGFGARHGGLTMVFGIVSTLFLSATAFATPTTGFYSYVANSTTNASSQATPVVWGAFQPWMMWLVWGVASIGLIMFFMGVLLIFVDIKDQKEHDENMDWI